MNSKPTCGIFSDNISMLRKFAIHAYPNGFFYSVRSPAGKKQYMFVFYNTSTKTLIIEKKDRDELD